MAEQITITVAAGGDDANARAFGAALGDVLDILESLAKEQLGKSQPVIWRIVGLQKHSPPSVTLECRQPVKVAGKFFEGLRQLQNGPSNPFPLRAMRATRRLGRRITRRQVDLVVVASPGMGTVEPTPVIAENADLALTTKYYFAPSSVDGKLDVVNVHSRAKFSVFDDTHFREVRCHFSDALFDKVKRNLGKRVTVVGTVKFDSATDRPIAITVEDIEPLDEHPDKPKLFAEMEPIDIPGGLSSEDYIRRLRDGV